MLTGFSSRRFGAAFCRIIFGTALVSGMCGAAKAQVQPVPVPFTERYAGGGTPCATGIRTFAAPNQASKAVGDNCPATQASLQTPVALAIDHYGNIFIADQSNNLIRVVYNGGDAMAAAITAANVQAPGLVPVKGYIYTIVGGPQSSPATTNNNYCGQNGTGLQGTDRQLDGCPGAQVYNQPRGFAVDNDGNLFMSNVGTAYTVRVFYVGGDAAARLIKLENPSITAPQPGYVYQIAGATASAVLAGDGGLATKASINIPRGLYIDADENVLLADTQNNLIRKIDSTTGIISTIVGFCSTSTSASKTCRIGDAAGDGLPATDSGVQMYWPYGIAFDMYGNMFIADSGANAATTATAGSTAGGVASSGRIRVVYAGGTLPGISNPVVGHIYTYAGGGAGTTPAQQTVFQFVYGVAVDAAGYLYINDYRATGSTGSNHMWRVDPTNGNIAAVVGNGKSTTTGYAAGNYCVGTSGLKMTDALGDGCPAAAVSFNLPQQAPAFDAQGNMYVAERNANIIRKFTYNNFFPSTAVGSSVVQPLAYMYPEGTTPASLSFTSQGTAMAEFSDVGTDDVCAAVGGYPAAEVCINNVTFSPAAPNTRLASMTVKDATGPLVSQAISGVGTSPVLAVDPGASAQLGSNIQPLGVSVDKNGNVYLSDGTGKQVLRTTVAGGAATPVLTGLNSPRQSTVDSFGNLFVADAGSNSIVELTADGKTASFSTGLNAPQGVVADRLGNVYVSDTGNNRVLYFSPETGSMLPVYMYPYTLKAPTTLALDTAGDLFIVDSGNSRVIEIPFNSVPQLVTLPSGVVPAAVDFDLANNFYMADTVSGQVLVQAAGSTTTTALTSNQSALTGIAIGSTGNLFVADSSQAFVAAYDRSQNTTTFAATNLGDTSLPLNLTLNNLGSDPFTFSTPAYTETGDATDFPQGGSGSCVSALALPPGATCTSSFVFQPTVAGARSATATFSSTTGDALSVHLSGTATNLVRTTLDLALTQPAGGTVTYGQTATYKVTLTPQSNAGAAPTGTIILLVDGRTQSTVAATTIPQNFDLTFTVGIHSVGVVYSGDSVYAGSNNSTSVDVGLGPTVTTSGYTQTSAGLVLSANVAATNPGSAALTGTVTFYVNNAAAASVPVGNGSVSATVLLADGSYPYYAVYSGDGNYATSSSTAQTLVLQRAATTTTLTSVPSTNAGVAGLLLTATVASTKAGTPTGTITFSNNGTVLVTQPLPSSGVVTFTTNGTSFNNYSFSASYSGDGLYQPSTGAITQGPDFVLVPPTAATFIPQVGQVAASIPVSPINGYSGTLTGSCNGLPQYAICRFQPLPFTLTPGASNTLSVVIFTGIDPNIAQNEMTPAMPGASRIVMAGLFLAPLFLIGMRRRIRRNPMLWLPVILMLVLLPITLTGCGIKTPAAATGKYVTPAGTYQVTVTLADANGLKRSGVVPVTVNGQ